MLNKWKSVELLTTTILQYNHIAAIMEQVIKLLCFITLILTVTATPHKTTKLADGLLIQKGDELRSHIASWTVLIVLQPPPPPNQLDQTIGQIRKVIEERSVAQPKPYITIHLIRQSLLDNWERRLKWIASHLETTSSLNQKNATPKNSTTTRKRRGILNFVGQLSNVLFGTATEDQISELRQRVNQASTTSAKVVHTVNELISVVNHSQSVLFDTQEHLDTLHNLTETFIAEHAVEIRQWKKEFVTAKTENRVEALISAAEQQAYYLTRARDVYFRRKLAIEDGRLSEEILPLEDLIDILDAAKQQQLHHLPYNWYYEHIQIKPLWIEEGEYLVYQATLPFTDDSNYLLYHVTSYPAPVYQNNAIQIKVQSPIAFDTEEGTAFVPTHCIGHNPSVCRTGPIYADTHFSCERGILSQNHELREMCQSHVMPQNDTVVTELSPGEFVIITPGESYAEQCSGERELTIKLEPGVYHIVVHPYCTLTGDDWKIRGLITRHSNHTIDDLIVDLDPINLDFNITVPDIHHAYKLPWMPLKELRRLNIQPIKPEDNVPYTNAETHLTSTVPTVWVNLVLTCLAIAALLIVGRFLYKRYKTKHIARGSSSGGGGGHSLICNTSR